MPDEPYPPSLEGQALDRLANDPLALDRPAINLPDGLVLVSTPIGNLGDLSARARATLQAADLVLCEDTRNTRRLAHLFEIRAPLSALHEHNENRRIPEILGLLGQGRRIALVSDAGTPLISDPGYRLVRAAVAAGFPVSAVPGPNAALMALTLSGLPPLPFLFLGFLPPRRAARQAALARLTGLEGAGLSATLVWHEAPHRVQATLADLAAAFGPREAAVARELTKRFEEIRRGTLPELAEHYRLSPARGEITVVVAPASGADPGAEAGRSPAAIEARLSALLALGVSVREAVAVVAAESGAPRRTVYARALALTRAPPEG
ncbi:MAG: 16S rRNA (cytidine(1402)-2'-O)-methyltransferase [Acetobacteraceae bacterium]